MDKHINYPRNKGKQSIHFWISNTTKPISSNEGTLPLTKSTTEAASDSITSGMTPISSAKKRPQKLRRPQPLEGKSQQLLAAKTTQKPGQGELQMTTPNPTS
ncbi:hypothetical protein ACOSP7_019729 [Xanthoceras sorbifolium]